MVCHISSELLCFILERYLLLPSLTPSCPPTGGTSSTKILFQFSLEVHQTVPHRERNATAMGTKRRRLQGV